MKIWHLTKDQYQNMFNRFKGNIRVCLSDLHLDPFIYTEEERKEIIRKAFNPDLPIYIDYYTKYGLVRFIKK